MPLELVPLHDSHFAAILRRAGPKPPGTDLTPPPIMLSWPVKTAADAHMRLQFAVAQARRRVEEDSTTRFLVVFETPDGEAAVDDDDDGREKGDVVAIARWHFYPDGPADIDGPQSSLRWEMAKLPQNGWQAAADAAEQPTPAMVDLLDVGDSGSGSWPPSFNRALHDHLMTTRDSARGSWIPKGQPCWVLNHLVTRADKRGRGAGGMLIQWGLDQAAEMGCAAYLEAGDLGKPLYERYGFRQVGESSVIDCRPFGVDTVMKLINMRCWPQSNKAAGRQSSTEETTAPHRAA